MHLFRSLAAAVLLFGLGSAQAADFSGAMPHRTAGQPDAACFNSSALGHIKSRFAWAERNTWHRGFVMASIGNPRPSGHPFAEPGLVARDYCMANSIMTNGDARPVYYVIEHGLGFAGLGRDIDFCVPGLDPWHVHDGDCRTVR